MTQFLQFNEVDIHFPIIPFSISFQGNQEMQKGWLIFLQHMNTRNMIFSSRSSTQEESCSHNSIDTSSRIPTLNVKIHSKVKNYHAQMLFGGWLVLWVFHCLAPLPPFSYIQIEIKNYSKLWSSIYQKNLSPTIKSLQQLLQHNGVLWKYVSIPK